MGPMVDTRDPAAVEDEVQTAYRSMFPQGDPQFVRRVFGWTILCFRGEHAGYQAVDARYHDLEHTLQGVLCFARILLGRQRANGEPALAQREFELGLLAMLLHDTGYLKKADDQEGTGAKYTLVHVDRSNAFAQELLSGKHYPPDAIAAVQQMIHCTGVNLDLAAIPFANPAERIAGFALGTADLLGQMAASDYVDKLPILYEEFVESARYHAGQWNLSDQFASAEDLIAKTPAFWEYAVLPRLEKDFAGLYRYLNDPYPAGSNLYVERIQDNIKRLKSRATKAAKLEA